MFWNNEFNLNSPTSHIDVLLQMQDSKLADILFEEDLLQELKTSNATLANFLNRPEIIAELVDNIADLTEEDCCDKLLYSRVHAAYISCEILSCGLAEIFAAFINHPESLKKVMTCLTIQPPRLPTNNSTKPTNRTAGREETVPDEKEASNEGELKEKIEVEKTEITEEQHINDEEKGQEDEKKVSGEGEDEEVIDSNHEIDQSTSQAQQDQSTKPADETSEQSVSDCTLNSTEEITMTKVVPQKATLVSKLISTIHTMGPIDLNCYISRNNESFSRLINLLVQNIDISGCFEILSTFVKRTEPTEMRIVFCEKLSQLDFVHKLIDVMTLSEIEDKQRNACQLLCDIIVIGRQEASEQQTQQQTNHGPTAQGILAEFLESADAVRVILNQMFQGNISNSTAIVCGMKVLQTLLEQKSANIMQMVARTIERTQDEIVKHLYKFHELLLNPPKQEPIKTTFGIIQKPLGYMRLEVVNLMRTLISTNSPVVVRKLVELGTMKVIVNLFIEYYWNNLLHTQVEQALCLIIKNCRHDEDSNYHIDIQQLNGHEQNNSSLLHGADIDKEKIVGEQQLDNGMGSDMDDDGKHRQPNTNQHDLNGFEQQSETDIPSRALLSQLLNECDLIGRLLMPNGVTNSLTVVTKKKNNLSNHNSSNHINNEDESPSNNKLLTNNNELNNSKEGKDVEDAPMDDSNRNLKENNKASMNSSDPEYQRSTILEMDRRRRRNGEQANFGHIIQMINSIAINRDLDTINEHLNEMQAKRPELYDRWTSFVNVDVASFKEISLYYDAQSANNNVNQRYGGNIQHNRNNFIQSIDLNSSNDGDDGDEQFLAYLSFTRETTLPKINVDVLPKLRRSKNAH